MASTNQTIAQTVAAYAAAHPAGPHQHYGQTLNPDGTPRLYWDAGWTGDSQGKPIQSALLGSNTNTGGTGTGGTGTVGTGTNGSGTTPAPTGVSQSAKDIINQFLADAGLAALSDSAWSQWKQGTTAAQIMDTIRTTPEYAKRFPAMKALAAQGRAIDEATYIAKERADIELMKSYGIPSGVFDTTDFLGKLIANNVNQTDLQKRLIAIQDTANSMNPTILKYAKDTYGLDKGDIMAYMLNPELSTPVLQQKAEAMKIGGAAYQAGLGLAQASAEDLANAGITQQQAQAGFGNVAQEQQFAQALPGDTSGSVTQQQLINAQFGLNPQDTLAVKKVQQGRVNEFAAGGGFAASQAGAGGLGVAGAGS